MASMIARRAALSSRSFTTSARRLATDPALKGETKRNPELYVRHIPNPQIIAFRWAQLSVWRSPGELRKLCGHDQDVLTEMLAK
jgi:hypothetical protein